MDSTDFGECGESARQKRAWLAVLLVLLASTISIALVLIPVNVSAATLYVGGVGPGNYTTIQAAINAASGGDTIFVYSGIYYEGLTIDKPLSLVGENRSTTTIRNTMSSAAVYATSSWVNITGFTITSSSQYSGIAIQGAGNVTISDNIITNHFVGVWCASSNDNAIVNNVISSNTYEGVEMSECNRIFLSGNSFVSKGIGIYGTVVSHWNSHTITTSNTVGGKPVYYWKDAVGGTIPAGAGEVILANCSSVVVENQSFGNGTIGVEIGFSKGSVIRNNTITSSVGEGIYLIYSDDNSLEWNRITGAQGISIPYSNRNTIGNNTIAGNMYGLSLYYSYENAIADNNISSNTLGSTQSPGITLSYSQRNTIERNTVALNAREGIRLTSSIKNRVLNNSLSSNRYGGLTLQEYSELNTVYGNTFTGGDYIDAAYSGNNTFVHNKVQGQFRSISLRYSDNNVVVHNPANISVTGSWNLISNNTGTVSVGGSHNIISGNSASISVSGPFNTVVNNSVDDGGGIYLTDADNTTVAENNVSRCRDGVYIYWSDGNLIVNNTLKSNGNHGVFLNASNNNVISGNTIMGSSYGIQIQWLTTNVTVKDNTLMNNDHGIYLVIYSYDNKVYHNDFVNNTVQASQDANNTWDDGYPSGGNYWSDYGGVDTYSGPNQNVPGSDGIGDTPYTIGDRYPLMKPLRTVPVTPSAPRNLQGSGGNSNATLNWTAPAYDGGRPITNYEIYRGTYPKGEVFVHEVGNVLSYTDTGLNNGWTYYYRVSARNAAEEGLRSNEASATPSSTPRVPGPPIGLAVIAGDKQVTLTWSPPTDTGGSPITNYRIHRGLSPGSEVQIAEIGNASTYIDAGLTNGQTYYYRVSAKNAVGEGQKSNEANATPTGAPSVPGPPIGLTAIGGNKQITLNWSLPVSDGGSPVTNYTIYRGTVSGGESFLAQIGSNRNYVDTSLSDGQSYHYQVTARNTIGEGQRSNEANATTWTIPGPLNSLAGLAGNGQVALTWLPPASNGGSSVTNYRIYRGTMAGGEAFLTELGNVLTYLDGGLANGQRYYYRVAAKNVVGEGSMSNEVWAVPATIPGAPTSLNAVEGDRQVTLTWTAPADDGGSAITNYMVYRGTAAGAESFLTQLGSSTSYVDGGLTNGRTYYYKVSAVNAVGEGSQSNEAVATPASPFAPPSAPGNLTAVPGDRQIALTWAAPSSDGGSPISNYRIYGGTTPGGESLLVEAGTVLTHVVAGLANGQTYYYQVTALNSVGESLRSVEVSATPTAPFTNSPPTCNIIAPVLYETAVGSYVVAGIANDIDGTVQRVEVKIDNGSWIVASGTTSWIYTWDTVAVVNGHHTITARSFDGVNYSADVSVTVSVGNQPPHPPGETSILEQAWFWVLLAVVIVETILLVLPLLNKWRGRATARKEEPEEKETAERPVKEKEE